MNELYHTSGENASGNCIERPGYYAVIPAVVRYDQNIPANAKLIYGEVSALIGPEGFCYASNAFLAGNYGFTEEAVSRMITKLIKAGYIIRELDTDASGQIIRRRLYLKVSAPDGRGIDQKINTPQPKNQEGIDQKIKENNLSNTNTLSQGRGRKKSSPDELDDVQMQSLLATKATALAAKLNFTPEQRDQVKELAVKWYSPRTVTSGSLPIHTELSVNRLFSKLEKGKTAGRIIDAMEEAMSRGWTSIPDRLLGLEDKKGNRTARAAAAPSVHLGAEL